MCTNMFQRAARPRSLNEDPGTAMLACRGLHITKLRPQFLTAPSGPMT